ncbi:hypothetical protein BZA70DRAFT_181673 [Myxozyma melibiosi]|uniref:Uncharacterized protein n=1 Tax=Myxozyma melibiosi TaxID=54550 RepID=A0ABR1F4D9_9ASCO
MASLPPSIPYQHTTVMPPAHKELITSDDFIDVALESAFRYTRSSRYAPLTAETHAEVYEQLAKACSNTPNLDLLREESTWIKEKLRQFEFTNYTEMLRAGLFPGISSVTTHLKLLRVLRDLRTEIMARDGMFGITDAEFPSYASSSDYDGRRLRWQVYVTYAVERYTKWFESLPSKGPISKTGPSYDLHGEGEAYEITTESLPPIDVLMVLHSHMLHPRVYWQDLMRSNRIGVFRSMKMPWEAMESAIQQPSNPNGAWKYNPFETAREYFELNTMRQFDLEDDSNLKCVVCPQCSSINSVELYNESGTGWVQSEFESTCTGCKYRITRDVLATAALLDDCQAFEERGVPLKGALLDYIGVQYSSQDFYAIPGALNAEVTALFAHITHREDFDIAQSKVREVFNKLSSSAVAEHRWHTKEFRVLSSYVKNCTPFCIDLELAVLRQCDFADEIVKYAYLHSPFRENMIKQATVRFFKFFFLVCFNADDFLAPPIDADIVWHTVMLDPAAYAATSFAFMGSIMDHNDDVADDTLSKSHELTMREWKRYKKVDDFSYDGCTCAICQATREYDSQPEQRKFKTSLKSRFLSKSSRAATIDQFYAIKCEELILSGDTLVQRLTHTYSVAEHLKLSAKAPVEPNYSHPYFLDLTPSPILSEKESQLPSYDDLPPAYTSEPAASDGFGEISSTRYGQKVWTPYYEYAYTIATVLPAAYYVGSVAGGGGLGGGSGTYGGGCASGTHPSGGCGGGGCGGGGN